MIQPVQHQSLSSWQNWFTTGLSCPFYSFVFSPFLSFKADCLPSTTGHRGYSLTFLRRMAYFYSEKPVKWSQLMVSGYITLYHPLFSYIILKRKDCQTLKLLLYMSEFVHICVIPLIRWKRATNVVCTGACTDFYVFTVDHLNNPRCCLSSLLYVRIWTFDQICDLSFRPHM